MKPTKYQYDVNGFCFFPEYVTSRRYERISQDIEMLPKSIVHSQSMATLSCVLDNFFYIFDYHYYIIIMVFFFFIEKSHILLFCTTCHYLTSGNALSYCPAWPPLVQNSLYPLYSARRSFDQRDVRCSP